MEPTPEQKAGLAELASRYESARLLLIGSPLDLGRQMEFESAEWALGNLLRAHGLGSIRWGVMWFATDGKAIRRGEVTQDRTGDLYFEDRAIGRVDVSPR